MMAPYGRKRLGQKIKNTIFSREKNGVFLIIEEN